MLDVEHSGCTLDATLLRASSLVAATTTRSKPERKQLRTLATASDLPVSTSTATRSPFLDASTSTLPSWRGASSSTL